MVAQSKRTIRKKGLALLNRLLKLVGREVIASEDLYPWQRRDRVMRRGDEKVVPEDARNELKPDNPTLLDLRRRYGAFDPRVTTPLIWHETHLRDEQLLLFRGESAYLWQERGENMNPISYGLTYYYQKEQDRLALLERLHEDGAFGAVTFEIEGTTISRDLLDSINEITFLESELGLSRWRDTSILDIGAGYGRLADRLTTAIPTINHYLCTDAYPQSTVLADFYLRYRNADRAESVPLDQIDLRMSEVQERGFPVRLAINIHSFPECRTEAIAWWMELLARYDVDYLFLVPNSYDNGGELMVNHNREDFSAIIAQNGYRLRTKRPKYIEPLVQEYGINPAQYYLFERI